MSAQEKNKIGTFHIKEKVQANIHDQRKKRKHFQNKVLGYFAVMLRQALFFIGALYHKSTLPQ